MRPSSKPPSWLAIVQDLAAKYPSENTQALSSLSSPTSPSNRYIVHRELLLASPTSVSPLFISTTDIRSPKVAQIRTEPIVSVARWYPTSNSQIRIVGEARIVSAKEAGADAVFWEEKRLEHWKKMSGHMKASFARPVAPGTKLGSYEEMNDWPQRLPEMEDAKDDETRKQLEFALSNFALIVIDPKQVDLSELSVMPNRQTNWTLRDDGEWEEAILCP